MIDVILDTLRAEFADFGNVREITRVVTRLLVAMALGACLG